MGADVCFVIRTNNCNQSTINAAMAEGWEFNVCCCPAQLVLHSGKSDWKICAVELVVGIYKVFMFCLLLLGPMTWNHHFGCHASALPACYASILSQLLNAKSRTTVAMYLISMPWVLHLVRY